MHQIHGEQGSGETHDVVFSGGPPWGFILSGGSEFGSKLYIKRVTNENKPIRGTILVGDEILSVNGVTCSSRAGANQMVHNADEDLKLKISRWNTNESDIHNVNDPSSPQVYDSMVETMGDLSQSYYSLKRNSIQTKNLNNNDKVVTSTTKYNIKPSSYYNRNKENSDHHTERAADGYKERLADAQPQQHGVQKISPSQPHRQKVTVKMVPAAARTSATVYPNNTGKAFLTEPETDIDQTDAVEHESVQKVSKARAMFENLSSTKAAEQPKAGITRPKLKTWNSGGSLLDERGGEMRWNVKPRHQEESNQLAPPVHKHSRSLPIEIAGQEFAAALAAYRQTPAMLETNTTTDATTTDRPKSAYYPVQAIDKGTVVPAVPHRYSQSDVLRNYRVRSSQGQLNTMDSRSAEDLLNIQEKPTNAPPDSGKNDSANELRQALSRYQQELIKNYPKFRHSISGKDVIPQKFQRKLSSDDNFSRGEPLRATIATTHTVRLSRSQTADEPSSLIYEGGENSMMSRLLQGQSAATLMKIEEEAKKKDNKNSTSQFVRSHSVGGSSSVRRGSVEPVMKSICIQTEIEEPDTEPVQRKTTDIQTSTDPSEHRTIKSPIARRPTLEREASVDELESGNSSFATDFEPAQFADIGATSDDLIHGDVQKDRSMVSPDMSLPNTSYIHRKDSSTDSAVYGMKDQSMINHTKTDSMNELNSINMAALHLDSHDGNEEEEFCDLPPPPDELLQEESEVINVHKEKPRRAINRTKKDSGPVSRNSSCVSTDSTTSTATVDSGIFVRLDSSPRTSPISSSQYYSNKDLSTSRETLDDDVRALDEQRPATSTPDRSHHYDDNYSNDVIQDSSNMTLGGHESPSGGSTTNIEDLDTEKTKLIESMREKINELREQEQEIAEEIKMNEELGKKVRGMVETKATQSEFSKYELFIGELNKIVALLLSLTQRLHRYEMMLQDLDMSNEQDMLKKDGLISKIDKLKSQHEEACYLREVNEKRGDNVAKFLEKYCTEEEFADFQYYVDMKSQLALMQSEIREKVKLGEERLKALEQTGSDWEFG